MIEDNNTKESLSQEATDEQTEEAGINTPKEIDEISIEEKLKDTQEKLLRSLAEVENQRRRFEKEVKDAYEFGSFNFAKESLAILDNLERAKLAMKTDEKLKSSKDLEKFLENVTIIEKDLVSIFERNRIKKINTKDKKFDPNFHQAMLEVDSNDKEGGIIVQEIQRGYMMKSRLLRPTLVGVTKKSEKTNKDVNNNEK